MEFASQFVKCTVVSDDKKVVEVKKRLLEKHRLEAIFSMPDDLFNPVAINTCILIFKAHNPHSKTKNNGRIDRNNQFDKIKELWLEKYINKENTAGISITKTINTEDEWCAEAYMETDYSNLKEVNFINIIRDYVGFLFCNNHIAIATDKPYHIKDITVNRCSWNFFTISTLFQMIEKAKCNNASALLTNGDHIYYIGAKKKDNGVMEKVKTVESIVSSGNAIVFIGDSRLCWIYNVSTI